ncbi:MAG: DNA methyltransferase [Solirubrobacteraceae bacterium]
MAQLEDLISQIDSPGLREALAREVKVLKERMPFGLVFERHLPEAVALASTVGVNVGDRVRLRTEANGSGDLIVHEIAGDKAKIANNGSEPHEVALGELLVVKRFSDSIYPTLTPIDSLDRSAERPYHAVINGENFHALQVMLHCWEGQVDCIYIDPPYNTGAKDWRYNNDFVDGNDSWRHSKWLSFMEKRLRLAKRLLKPDSVLICTIDEKEYLRLGLLLEQVFPGRRIQMVSSLINPALQARPGAFGRSDEYLFFVMQGSFAPQRTLLSRDWVSDKGRTFIGTARWDLLRRSGTSPARSDSPGGFYPIYVDPDGPKFAGVGDALPAGTSKPPKLKGAVALLPIRKNGSEGRWQVSPTTLRSYQDQGRVRIGGDKKKGYTIYYLKGGEYDKVLNGEYPITGRNPDGSLMIGEGEGEEVIAVPSTQWRIPSHDSTQYGSRLIAKFLPDNPFTFPKSLYAVHDALRFFLADKPDAFIIDFFAGSGTTLHATALLNAEDDGRRRCTLVTNNEVNDKVAKRLREDGHFPGDEQYESHGIFENATKRRCIAALTGERSDGQPAEGAYLDGRAFSEGFDENCQFLRLDYLSPDEVELGRAFEAIHPLLWLIAGARGALPQIEPNGDMALAEENGYAILFNELAFRDFVSALNDATGVAHVFLVTDSEDAYGEMCEGLGAGHVPRMLYRDYLRSFRIAAGAA